MQLLLLATALLTLTTSSYQLQVDNLEDVLVYPLEAPTNIRKRQVASITPGADHDAFVEEKLIQHSQALEHLVKMVSTTSIIATRLMEHCIRTIEKPSMPEAVKVIRSTDSDDPGARDDTADSPLSRLGKKIPLYGNFVKNLARGQFRSDSEPQVIVEPVYDTKLLGHV